VPLFLGERAGARILAVGASLASLDTDHQGDFTTWEFLPAGEMGDVVFRSLGLSFTASNGYSFGITPYVDGVSLGEQAFGGSGTVTNGQAQVYVKARGTRIAARVRTLTRTGDITISNLQVGFWPIRTWP